jgi:micrococcal nuclease
MNRKSVIVGGMAAVVLIVGGITAASISNGSTATASAPMPAPASAVPASETAPSPAAVTTTVTRVIDGDTVETTDTAGTVLTVRIIGVDAPEMDTCEGAAAAEAMTVIALNQTVTLPLGGDGEDLDKHGRSLRYIDLNSTATDAGFTLIQQGHAVARYDSRDGYREHTRENAYIAADALAPNYVCAPVPTQEPAPAPAPVPGPAQAPEPEPTRAPAPEPASAPEASASAYYANCDAARAAGAAPLHAGEPGYSTKLDRDKDGVACE